MLEGIEVRLRGVVDVGGVDQVVAAADEAQPAGLRDRAMLYTMYASGLRVPRAVGDFLILDALRASSGDAIAVSDDAMADAVRLMGRTTGVFAAPEGGATLAGLAALLESGRVERDAEIVLFNTGSGLKYL